MQCAISNSEVVQNTSSQDIFITKTRPCNKQRFFFSAVKNEHLIRKTIMIDIFNIFLKTKIVGKRKNRFGEAVLTSTHNLCFDK